MAALGFFLGSALPVSAAVEDLWVTEIMPSTRQVELTNVGADPVTITTNFRWCHRFTYPAVVASNTTFAPGETRVFTISNLNTSLSEIWLYQGSVFSGAAGEASIVSGVKYGGATATGREDVATNAGIWNGVSSFVPLPPAGMSLQVSGPDPYAAAHWTPGPPNLGTFSRPVAPFAITEIARSGTDVISLNWTGGEPPFRVQASVDLGDGGWENVGPRTTAQSATFTLPGENRFFRVLSNAPDLSVTYTVTFASTWAVGTHPSFPANAHFSGLIGGTHGDGVTFWEPGALASPGIKNMAETGSKTPLTGEVMAAITAGTAENLLSGGGLASTPASVALQFSISPDFPLVTLVSMIAPSPDWFVGVHGMNLFVDGQWLDDVTVDLFPYDAGTDSGANFTSANAVTSPPEPIFRITGAPLAINGTVAPFGTFRFVRMP